MSNDLISFILPTYKKTVAQFNKTVNSLIDQSYKNIEILVVFDGPDPVLESNAEKWKKENPDKFNYFVIDHAGACAARNYGFKQSKGEIISFFDVDSYAEPEMASVWMMFFDEDKPCDFVYGQYKWSDPQYPGYDSEPNFDSWLLQKYNFLCSMWPLRRRNVVEWDEKLTGLQDWDFWRRVVEAGAVGRFNKGYGFSTEFPDKQSISGQGVEKKIERIKAIRAKYQDPESDVLVLGFVYKREAIRVAKILGADYFANPHFYMIKDYKMVLSVGFNPKEIEEVSAVFRNAAAGTTRAIYWTGIDCQQLLYGPFAEVQKWRQAIKESVALHFCPDMLSKNALAELGIEAEIMPLPRDKGVLLNSLPKKFKVLVFTDDHFSPPIESVVKAMPDISFEKVVPDRDINLADFSLVLHFTIDRRLNEGSKNALIQGRYLISNIEAPFTGFIDLTEEPDKFKNEIINKIRALEGVTEINTEARDYYWEESSPETFKKKVQALMTPKLEVVNV